MVYIILGEGFEEMEAIVPCDMLRRAGIEVQLAGIGGTVIRGSRGICVSADLTVEQMDYTQVDMIVLPGGLGGVESILASKTVLNAVQQVYQNGHYVAAICAAPTVLAKLGITDNKKATCYPGMENQMGAAQMLPNAKAVTDGHVITGTAAGTAYDFALELITALRGKAAAAQVAKGIVLTQ